MFGGFLPAAHRANRFAQPPWDFSVPGWQHWLLPQCIPDASTCIAEALPRHKPTSPTPCVIKKESAISWRGSFDFLQTQSKLHEAAASCNLLWVCKKSNDPLQEIADSFFMTHGVGDVGLCRGRASAIQVEASGMHWGKSQCCQPGTEKSHGG